MVGAARVEPGELVLDIGAGDGALTTELVRAGAQVIAIELHPARAERLRQRFADGPVTVVRADAAELRLPGRPFRVVANPPYAVSVAILKRLLNKRSRLRAADLVLPRWLVTRAVDGRLAGAGRWQRTWRAERGLVVPRSAFRPTPRAGSVVLRLTAVGPAVVSSRPVHGRR